MWMCVASTTTGAGKKSSQRIFGVRLSMSLCVFYILCWKKCSNFSSQPVYRIWVRWRREIGKKKRKNEKTEKKWNSVTAPYDCVCMCSGKGLTRKNRFLKREKMLATIFHLLFATGQPKYQAVLHHIILLSAVAVAAATATITATAAAACLPLFAFLFRYLLLYTGFCRHFLCFSRRFTKIKTPSTYPQPKRIHINFQQRDNSNCT